MQCRERQGGGGRRKGGNGGCEGRQVALLSLLPAAPDTYAPAHDRTARATPRPCRSGHCTPVPRAVPAGVPAVPAGVPCGCPRGTLEYSVDTCRVLDSSREYPVGARGVLEGY